MTQRGFNISTVSQSPRWGLNETRQAFTPELINEACYVDMRANKDVFDNMRKSPKVKFDGKIFSYKDDDNHFLLIGAMASFIGYTFTLTFAVDYSLAHGLERELRQ
ncbi:hypothetical protein Ahy_A02g008515 [Arachis hypogaea]|uniref:Uncharacterized protein n=1 Tax=Arachis hypogaea TaxID=3818 RepID=A0A445EEI1_ARAHY|nr:hypothetical protein Ahy_A02g008515 [Arachis hypogaea]